MANFFAKPTTPTASAAKGNKKPKQEVALAGVTYLAQIVALEKQLDALKAVAEAPLKDAIFDYMTVNTEGSQPENFKAIEEGAFASMEIRKRSTNSPLKEIEIAALQKNKIPYDEQTEFGINSNYVGNSDLLEKVSAALSTIKDLPADFITSKMKCVVTDDTMAAVFNMRTKQGKVDREGIAGMLPVVAVPAIKPVYTGKFQEAIDTVSKALAELAPETEEKAEAPVVAKAKKKK